MTKSFVTRFAPSPTGYLHLGHAYSALLAYQAAKMRGGRFILRIEDIDTTRCRPEFETTILEDLAWLGLEWEEPVRRQSRHFEEYRGVLDTLAAKGVLYRCFCTRAEIKFELERSQSAPHGPEGPLYPGICRHLPLDEVGRNIEEGKPFALRLDVEKALGLVGGKLTFFEKGKQVMAEPETLGDVVLARKDTPASYHLSVVSDDHAQGVTHVIRGEDLLHSTHIHRLLQHLLGYTPPKYHHHGLLAGPDGRRFAKRDRSLTLKSLRESGQTPADIIELIIKHGGDPDAKLLF